MGRIITRGGKDANGVPFAVPDEYPTLKANGGVNDKRYWGQVFRALIFLADNEWSSSMGGLLMHNLAEEFLRNYYRSQTLPTGELVANCRPLEVEVVEHGGWAMIFTLAPCSAATPDKPQWRMPLITIASANDAAIFAGAQLHWRHNGYWCERHYVATVRRDDSDEFPLVFDHDAVGYCISLGKQSPLTKKNMEVKN